MVPLGYLAAFLYSRLAADGRRSHRHRWFLASWHPTSGDGTFGVGVFICVCAKVKRVVYSQDEATLEVVDPHGLQTPLMEKRT